MSHLFQALKVDVNKKLVVYTQYDASLLKRDLSQHFFDYLDLPLLHNCYCSGILKIYEYCMVIFLVVLQMENRANDSNIPSTMYLPKSRSIKKRHDLRI